MLKKILELVKGVALGLGMGVLVVGSIWYNLIGSYQLEHWFYSFF